MKIIRNKKNDDIIDLGEINLPSSWDEVTLGIAVAYTKAASEDISDYEKLVKAAAAFSQKDEDFIKNLPLPILETILEKLKFILSTKKEENVEPTNSIKIDDETYSINFKEQLRVGEFVALETAMKTDPNGYLPQALAILCRRDGELYDSRFENEILPSRIEFWKQQKFVDVKPLIDFFLNKYEIFKKTLVISSTIDQAKSLIAQDIENLLKDGEASEQCTRWQRRKLKRLLKSTKQI